MADEFKVDVSLSLPEGRQVHGVRPVRILNLIPFGDNIVTNVTSL